MIVACHTIQDLEKPIPNALILVLFYAIHYQFPNAKPHYQVNRETTRGKEIDRIAHISHEPNSETFPKFTKYRLEESFNIAMS
jgi:hypothetical protein